MMGWQRHCLQHTNQLARCNNRSKVQVSTVPKSALLQVTSTGSALILVQKGVHEVVEPGPALFIDCPRTWSTWMRPDRLSVFRANGHQGTWNLVPPSRVPNLWWGAAPRAL